MGLDVVNHQLLAVPLPLSHHSLLPVPVNGHLLVVWAVNSGLALLLDVEVEQGDAGTPSLSH